MKRKTILSIVMSLCAFACVAEEPTVRVWTGAGGDGLASTAENWSPSGKPASGEAIVLDARGNGYPLRWDAAMKGVSPAGWTQDGYTESVTFETVYDSEGFDKVTIDGDVILMSGSWTHLGNSQSALYRLFVEVAGKMTIGADAVITADGLGYGNPKTIGGEQGVSKYRSEGGSHGGRAGSTDAANGNTGSIEPYGCCYAPETLGCGGNWVSGINGGGAVRLVVGGALTLNGAVRADGIMNAASGKYYSGSGGSVWITAGSIAGTGKVTANAPSTEYPGAGGRVAVVLTGEGNDFSQFDLVRQAEAMCLRANDAFAGGVGTIYGETADDTAHQGWLILKAYDGAKEPSSPLRYGDPFSYEVKELAFAHVTLTNRVTLRIGAGCTLHVADTKFDLSDRSGYVNRVFVDGGTVDFGAGTPKISGNFTFASPLQVDGDLEILSGGVLAADGGVTVGGNMTVRAGGTLTCGGPYAEPKALSLSVTGNLTVEEGGAIDVEGKGFPIGMTVPGQAISGNWCGAGHGGCGWRSGNDSPVVPYGSIRDPRTPGSGTVAGSAGAGFSGGGVVILTVGGALVNNGLIAARSKNSVSGSSQAVGPGGSINITAGTISGSGKIDASSHDRAAFCGANAVSGGGRVAVTLTAAGADFANFSTDRIVAYGGSCGARTGGAGTVYLRTAGQAIDEGVLVIRNLSSGYANEVMKPTPIGGLVENRAFGSVVIDGGATLALAKGETIVVNGDWCNAANFTAAAGSTVLFAGTTEASYAGNTTFAKVGCSSPGKKILFASGASLGVTESAAFEGEEDDFISLVSATAGQSWSLNVGEAQMTAVAIRDCESATAFDVLDGEDLGGNSPNIVFKKSQPAATLMWTGATSSAWTVGSNWDADRAPAAVDTVVIPPGCPNYPALSVPVTVATLVIEDGASLDPGAVVLKVTGLVTVSGRLASAGACALELGGDMMASGAVSLPNGVLSLKGASTQSVSCATGAFASYAQFCPSVTLNGTFEFADFTVGDGSSTFAVSFGAGARLTTHDFSVRGNADTKSVALGCAEFGGTWLLKTLKSSVVGARVGGCDASAGLPIVPQDCLATDDRNRNWYFSDTRIHWDGTGEVPAAGSDVVVDPNADVTLVSDAAWANLTVASGGKLTVNATLALTGSATVDDGATLVWNRPGTIAGNLLLFSGATLTHDANVDAEQNKIDLHVGAEMLIEHDAKIDVTGMGYAMRKGPGAPAKSEAGGTYGGCGYLGSAKESASGYGSLVWPANCGSGGTRNKSGGGGSVALVCGTLTIDGEIAADGGSTDANEGFYTGSGGGIALRAARISGAGHIHANGGLGTQMFLGGGGRIALIATQAGGDAFTGILRTFGGGTGSSNFDGSAGTIYREDGTDGAGCGTLLVANNATKISIGNFDKSDRTDFPGAENPSETKHVTVRVKSYGTLYLTRDATVQDIVLEDATARIKLNGHTLSVLARRHPVSPNDATQVIADGGEIKFVRGLVILVK